MRWPLWFLLFGALTPADELAAAIGPALGLGSGQARWQLLPSWPTLQPLAALLPCGTLRGALLALAALPLLAAAGWLCAMAAGALLLALAAAHCARNAHAVQ